MIQILDQKALHELKQRINRYERLLQQRRALDQQLERINKELSLSDGRVASAPSQSAGVKKSEAISRAMKRVWAERRKKQAQAAATPGTKSRKTPASAAKPATRKSPTAANKARRAAMRRYWAEKRKAAEMR